MLAYPAWLTALDRAQIDAALDRAFASAVMVDTQLQFPSTAHAVDAVLVVARVIVDVLPRRSRPAAVDLRAELDKLIDELIVLIARYTPSADLDTVAAAAHDALRAVSWWTNAAPSFGTQLAALKAEAGPGRCTLEDLAAMADVDRRTVSRYLNDEITPEPARVLKLEQGLTALLDKTVKFQR